MAFKNRFLPWWTNHDDDVVLDNSIPVYLDKEHDILESTISAHQVQGPGTASDIPLSSMPLDQGHEDPPTPPPFCTPVIQEITLRKGWSWGTSRSSINARPDPEH